ncbi:MAG: hypothetical protein KDA78_20750, partial [Planctomycetaceae bacterium]|nr:hypothetical protein [Planctomycetaceae bacterium]
MHQQDILKTSSKWFRGVSLVSGADGEVYLSDWTDEGECHDSDGVHRTSGRVYRITYGKPGQHFQGDLAQKSNDELWKLQEYSNNWYARHARRILLDRQPGAEWFSKHASAISWSDSTLADLQRMWIGISLGSFGVEDLNRFLDSNSEYVRSWGPRILCEQQRIEPGAWQKLIEHARHESSAYVRLSLASAVRRMPLKQRIEMARVLANYPEDAEDHDARLLLWYGLEMAVAQFPAESLELTSYKSLGKVPSFIARRLMHESIRNPEVASQLAVALTHAGSDFQRTSLLTGMVEGSRGVRKLTPPKQWDDVVASLGEQDSLKPLVQELMIVYGDGRAFEELIALVRNNDAVGIDRIGALKQLAERDAPGLLPVLKQGINDRVIAEAAVTALAQYDDPEIPQLILRRYRSMKKPEQSAALETLCSRPQYAQQLLEAMSRKELGEVELSASQARQIHQFNDQKLTTLLESVWGTL